MAVAVIQDWIEPETNRSTSNYDDISEKLMAQDDPIDGLHFHCAGFTGNGFRIFEVWESLSDYERFVSDRLMPLMQSSGAGGEQPTVTSYELHAFVTP